jgi:hypothetical protein
VEVVPIPPAFPIPQAFNLPAQPLDTPELSLPAWVTPPNRIDNIQELIPPNVPERNNQIEKKQEKSEEAKEKDKKEKEKEEEKTEEQEFEGFTPPIGTPKIQIPLRLLQQNQQQQVEDVSVFENSVIIPGIDYEMPLPSTEVMVTAATTASIAAVVSVTGTLAAKTVFDYLLKLIKPTLKIVVNKLAKARGKPTTSWARQRLQERRHK